MGEGERGVRVEEGVGGGGGEEEGEVKRERNEEMGEGGGGGRGWSCSRCSSISCSCCSGFCSISSFPFLFSRSEGRREKQNEKATTLGPISIYFLFQSNKKEKGRQKEKRGEGDSTFCCSENQEVC